MRRLVERRLIMAVKKDVANQGSVAGRERAALVLDKHQVPGHVLLDTQGLDSQNR
jgi:hypothetical protein